MGPKMSQEASVMRRLVYVVAACCTALEAYAAQTDPGARMLAYSAQPTAYFNQRAAEVAKIYDGFFFTIGSWDGGIATHLGLGPDLSPASDWKDKVRENLVHLREAGVTENLLGVHFGETEAWPSPQTLLSETFTEKFTRHFAALGREAKELGFRGVSIDVEYPYPRYRLDHEIYTYDGYTAEDLLAAASRQGRAVMSALLDEFPDAVVFVLPGALWVSPIARLFQLAMLQVMAERDAPGGFHLGSERSYCLLDPVSQVAIPREGDLAVAALVHDRRVLDYWERRCTVAPGVWPLHMVETEGPGYPVRPWSEELAELRLQMAILRAVTKRYVWSYSGQPVWYRHTQEIEQQFGLTKQTFDGADEAIAGWHAVLTDSGPIGDPRIARLIRCVRAFDRGALDAAALCGRFGTPGEWLMLGPLSNPFVEPAFAAPSAIHWPIRRDLPVLGRDGVVRWFAFKNYEPLGSVRLRAVLDSYKTDNASMHLVSFVRAKKAVNGFLWVGWDDGVAVWLNDTPVIDRLAYPERGHGILFRDRYNFEEKVPIFIPKGTSRLTVTSINAKGNWGVNLRLADEDGYPLKGVSFARE